ncbi:glycosyl hydrolases family 35-domain-containing protein [Xylaria sp. FL0933]|nr:glycosyl hydrolases family 35-domain-containing protein [Xylaria sp. FL0933]
MKMRCSLLSLTLTAATAAVPSLAANSFGYDGAKFLLNGETYQILGGQIDPQRVPWQLWDSRLAMARAMGLNTVFSYLYWDQIEPAQGKYVTDGNNNIAAWVQKAEQQGLHVVLRVGPYICGEHEWGGFPSWLSTISNMTVRSNNPQFLGATKSYLDFLGSWLQPYFASNGGPIIMAQVENEYGFYSNDHSYTNALADLFKDALPAVQLYTNDGSGQAIRDGSIPGVLAETDGGFDGFGNRDTWIDPSSRGPYLDGEYYITWIDQWASNHTHQADSGNTEKIQSIQNDLSTAIKNGSSFSIYMFHGGTNWGFQNGADFGDAYEPVTTSYDYGAPLDESGRPNDIYHALRQTITSLVSGVPDVPSLPAVVGTDPITMTPYTSLFDQLPSATSAQFPTNMEELGQATGYILYRYTAEKDINGDLKIGDGPRDRALIYVNKQRVGLIDGTYVGPHVVSNLSLKANDQLDILVENLGRINFGGLIPDQRKGIVGNVTIGDTVLTGFDQFTLPCDTPFDFSDSSPLESVSPSDPPVWYGGSFDMGTDDPSDTFLSLPGWVKGVVYVNGWNLGRYWTVGPQQQLYLPGVYLKNSNNTVAVLNLEPTGKEGTVQGIATRSWGNNPDPDAPAS